MGSSLKELLAINGQKITFAGFGWDYGGYIQSYNNGTLENSAVHFRLGLAEESDNSLLGDNIFDTDMPSVKAAMNKITVGHISLVLNRAKE